jgi:hypothetical protein
LEVLEKGYYSPFPWMVNPEFRNVIVFLSNISINSGPFAIGKKEVELVGKDS